MGTKIKQSQNSTTFIRCPKGQYTFTRVPSNIVALGGYKEAIMTQIIANKDGWNVVKSEIFNRLDFPERKFLNAWKELEALGYITIERKWGSYHYIINENPNSTTCTDAGCINPTTGNSTSCTGASLTTINNNYYNTGEATDGSSLKAEATSGTTTDPDSQFEELNKLFPPEVIRPNGYRDYLKTDLKRCQELYNQYLSEGLLSHAEILNCLKVELNVRKQSGKMPYMKRFVQWLKKREFEAYRDQTEEPAYEPYGTKLL